MPVLIRRMLGLMTAVLMFLGCSGGEKIPDALGVYADTGEGFVEIKSSYEQIGNKKYKRTGREDFARVDGFNGFLVNVPGVDITNSKIYVFDVPEYYYWEEIHTDRLLTSVDAKITRVRDDTYMVSPRASVETIRTKLDREFSGHVLLEVTMPLGIADRMYAVSVIR